MIIPYIVENLLEVNENINPVFKNGIIVIDNVYKNYEDLYEILQNVPVVRWKHHINGKNFVDYYDCRSTLATPFVKKENIFLINLIKKQILEHYDLYVELENDILDFNFYKNIKSNIPNNFQHFPHIENSFNCIIYIDKVSSGGTAIYEGDKFIVNEEQYNLLYDISSLRINLIPSTPNRLVIFPGWLYHGGFIENHNSYIDHWRINQLLFFQKK